MAKPAMTQVPSGLLLGMLLVLSLADGSAGQVFFSLPMGSLEAPEEARLEYIRLATTNQTYVETIKRSRVLLQSRPDRICSPQEVQNALRGSFDPLLAGNLLRLAFHDAGTFQASDRSGGLDGSIRFELNRPENFNLQFGWGVIENVKQDLATNSACVVSYADLVAFAGAAAIAMTGGPKVSLPMGRADAQGPNPLGRLPDPNMPVGLLKQIFFNQGFSVDEFVTLTGAHTIGFQRATMSPLDPTPTTFDTAYWHELSQNGGAFASDRAVWTDPQCHAVSSVYASNPQAFPHDFAAVYKKMTSHATFVRI